MWSQNPVGRSPWLGNELKPLRILIRSRWPLTLPKPRTIARSRSFGSSNQIPVMKCGSSSCCSSVCLRMAECSGNMVCCRCCRCCCCCVEAIGRTAAVWPFADEGKTRPIYLKCPFVYTYAKRVGLNASVCTRMLIWTQRTQTNVQGGLVKTGLIWISIAFLLYNAQRK